MQKNNIKKLSEITHHDIAEVGYKAAYLGDLKRMNFDVPDGFIITKSFFHEYLKQTNIAPEINTELYRLNYEDLNSLRKVYELISTLILQTEFPHELEDEILSAYNKLDSNFTSVRSSATAEHLDTASWDFELPSFLNINEAGLIDIIKKCWARLFHPRCLTLRCQGNLKDCPVSMAIFVQKMVAANKSGLYFSQNPVNENPHQAALEIIYGLPDIQHQLNLHPDTYIIDKFTKELIDINIHPQDTMLKKSWGSIKAEKIKLNQQFSQKASNAELKKILSQCMKIEKKYEKPIVLEWALDKDGLHFLQINKLISSVNTANQ
ncbi:PEP/pyruvate-binding domain-containing protein [Patescibacteria group bacterium]|nr:PEP/pyruvate-binding domain-containing protein [Patescibacteria group bacterium]